MEFEHHPHIVLDLFLVISINQKRQGSAVTAAGRFNNIRIKFFIGHRIAIHKILAGELRVLFEVVVGTIGNALKFRPAKREEILDIGAARRVMRQLVVGMRPQAQLVLGHAQIEIPLQTGLDPVFVTFRGLFGPAEIFDFHLLEFAGAERKIARSNFVTERFADLTDTKRQFAVGGIHNIGKVDKNPLRGFGAHVDRGAGVFHGSQRCPEHKIESTRFGESSAAAPRTFAVFDMIRTQTTSAFGIPAVHQHIGKIGRVTRSFPGFGMHKNSRVQSDHIVAILNHGLPPGRLDIAFEFRADRTIVPGPVKAAINFGRRENKTAAFAERNNFFHQFGSFHNSGYCNKACRFFKRDVKIIRK